MAARVAVACEIGARVRQTLSGARACGDLGLFEVGGDEVGEEA
jgi:hypothetical protein